MIWNFSILLSPLLGKSKLLPLMRQSRVRNARPGAYTQYLTDNTKNYLSVNTMNG